MKRSGPQPPPGQRRSKTIPKNNPGTVVRNRNKQRRAASAERRTLVVNGEPDRSDQDRLDRDNEKFRAGLLEETGYGSITDALKGDGRGYLRPSNERRISVANGERDTQARLDSILEDLAKDPALSNQQRYSHLKELYDTIPEFRESVDKFALDNEMSFRDSLLTIATRVESALNNGSSTTYGLPRVSKRSRSASSARASTAVDKRDMVHLVQMWRENATEPEYRFPDLLDQYPAEQLVEGIRNFKNSYTDPQIREVDKWVRKLIAEANANRQQEDRDREILVSRFYDFMRDPRTLEELERRIRPVRESSVDGFQTLSPDGAGPGNREELAPRDPRRRSVTVGEAGEFVNQMRENVAADVGQLRETIDATAGNFRNELTYIKSYLSNLVAPFLNEINEVNVTGLRNDLGNLEARVQKSLTAFDNLGTVVNDSLTHFQGQVDDTNDHLEALQQKYERLVLMTNGLTGEIRDHLKKSVGSLNDRDKEIEKKLEKFQDVVRAQVDEKLATAFEDQSNRLDWYNEEITKLNEQHSALSDRVGNIPSSAPGGGSGPSRPPSPNSPLPGLPRGAGNGDPPHEGGGGGGGGFANSGSTRKEIAQDDPNGMVSSSSAEEKLGQLNSLLGVDNEQLNRYFTTKLAYLWRSTHDERQVRNALTGAARVGNFNGGVVDPVYDLPDEIRSFLRDMTLEDSEVYARHLDSLKDLQATHHMLLAKSQVLLNTNNNNLKNRLTRIKQELEDVNGSEKLKNLKELFGVKYQSKAQSLKEFVSKEKLDTTQLTDKERRVLDLAEEYLDFIKSGQAVKEKTRKLRVKLAEYNNEENGLMHVIRAANIDLSHPAKQVESLKKNVSDILDAIHTKKKGDEEEKKVLKQELASHRADVERLVRSLWVKEPIERIAAVNARIQKTVSSGNRTREVAVPRPRAPKEPVRKKTVKKAKKEVVTPVTDADAVWKKIMQNQRWKG